jgi:hypothetical protein
MMPGSSAEEIRRAGVRRSGKLFVGAGAVLFGVVFGTGCASEPVSTAVLLHLHLDQNEVRRPFFLTLDWFGPKTHIESWRVPAEGPLPDTDTRLASVFIERNILEVGLRRAFVHGTSFDQKTSFWGAVRVQQQAGVWVESSLVVRVGGFSDGDGDGLPDSVDECSNPKDDFAGCP